MADILLTEKYRPKKLDEMVGQDISKIKEMIKEPMKMPNFLFVSRSPGTGKCLGKDTSIIMFDGTIKKVQDIKEGEQLMGIDSTPRIVSNVITGRSIMYKIEQNYGDDYIINKDHILSLYPTGEEFKKEWIKNINVEEFLKRRRTTQQRLKGLKVSIDFDEKPIDIEPYYLGIWLGDGNSSSQNITNPNIEIIDYLEKYASRLNLKLKNHSHDPREINQCPYWSISCENKYPNRNKLLEMLRKNNLIENKHIPRNYLYNTRKIRLELLAGLIDSDGFNDAGRCYEIVQKRDDLANDIVYLARSLGFMATIRKKKSSIKDIEREIIFTGEYNRIFISGKLWEIPVKVERKKIKEHKRQKNCLYTGIKITQLKEDDYYGFQLDKDGMFLLGDFTVTHNTTATFCIKNEIGCPASDFLSCNSSDERKLEFIRDKLKPFSQSMRAKKDVPRLIMLDEMDGMLTATQEALRGLMEKYAKNVRFIITANDENGIIEPIRSRCVIIRFKEPPKEDIKNRLYDICTKENIKFDVPSLVKIVDIFYPDMRSMINKIQELASVGITEDKIRTISELEDTFYVILKAKDGYAARKFIIDNNLNPSDLLKRTFQNILMHETRRSILEQLIFFIAEINYRMTVGSDKEIQMAAFIEKYMELTNNVLCETKQSFL